ncbi:roadblock/LC7 domain-containing protein [Saccharopolyspora sp. MS10]|uniref:roadblock/LC7 domain-containing protein n=1 Tax=Saccharopolyspora sp. MS10 TaxID=3385973 RepID=UPI0039A369D6
MTPQETMSRRFGWLVTDFTQRVAGVAHAIVVSADGLLLTSSTNLPRDRAEQLAAVSSGLLSLTNGAAKCFEAGEVTETIVEMQYGTLIQMGISDGSCLTALAAPQCDMGLIAYEMAMLVERVGQILTPELRHQLQGAGNPLSRPAAVR